MATLLHDSSLTAAAHWQWMAADRWPHAGRASELHNVRLMQRRFIVYEAEGTQESRAVHEHHLAPKQEQRRQAVFEQHLIAQQRPQADLGPALVAINQDATTGESLPGLQGMHGVESWWPAAQLQALRAGAGLQRWSKASPSPPLERTLKSPSASFQPPLRILLCCLPASSSLHITDTTHPKRTTPLDNAGRCPLSIMQEGQWPAVWPWGLLSSHMLLARHQRAPPQAPGCVADPAQDEDFGREQSNRGGTNVTHETSSAASDAASKPADGGPGEGPAGTTCPSWAPALTVGGEVGLRLLFSAKC